MLTLSVVGCTGNGDKETTTHPDSTLRIWQAALGICDERPNDALAMIDSAEDAGEMQSHKANLLRSKIFSAPSNLLNLDTARQLCAALLLNEEADEDLHFRYNVLDQLRNIAYLQDDYEDLLRWSTKLDTLCREQGEEALALRAEADVALALAQLGQRERGLQILDKIITKLDAVKKFNELDVCIIAMKRKLLILDENREHEPQIPLALRLIAKCDDYEHNAAIYSDGTFREPATDEVSKYCDFYRAKGYAYAAHAYAAQGDKNAARRYVDLFENTEYGQTLDGREIITSTWFELGDYGKMMVTYDELMKKMGRDTINIKYARILRNLAVATGALKQYRTSESHWKSYAHLVRQLNDSLMRSKAHSFAARYRAQEQQALIRQKEMESERILLISIFGVLAALIASSLAYWLYRQKNKLLRKNEVITEQIREAMVYKEKYLDVVNSPTNSRTTVELGKTHDGHASTDDDADSCELSANDVEASDGDITPESNLKTMTDGELFRFLSDAILREHLYLDPNFGRQSIVDRFSISPHRIGAAFKRGSRFSSLPDFVRDCRLQHACKVLLEHPEMSVSDVAASSGFSHLAVFSRVFKDKYSMSPSDYRLQVSKT